MGGRPGHGVTRALVILLHGVNARGRDVARIAAGWRLPGTTVVAPDAPFASDQSPGARMWFSLAGITAENRPGRVVAARAAFDAVIGDAVRAAGLHGRLDRVALVGFSQGTIMALDAVASGRWPVAGVVGFSGRFATADATKAGTPVLLVHGTDDPAIPVAESQNAETCLAAAGCPVSLTVLPALGHWVDDRGAALAGAFLARALADPPA